ncbi:methyltransferase domain-containing protein [Brevibacillus sp. SYP-B805]|uniref:methyltransferase domain-containing protein n=1 Tax=Brevibacillus sp. SYP-B805 TaxID=1578199 RepID=UPI0013EAB968|nr:methyltransferase domain-containing protein [Brevibacillus sp. SYP-B805]
MAAIFFEIHKDIPREGPGSNESTRKAYGLLQGLPPRPQILDIGCGPGMQTLELARLTDGSITAVDTHEPFLAELTRRAAAAGLQGKITPLVASMFSLPFPAKSFDVIWSEGAIFIIGFERGLREWRSYLKPNGFLAVTEISWLRRDLPDEVAQFWAANYPAMKSVGENIDLIRQTGYVPVDHFVLPESDWWNDYYDPLEKRVAVLREKYADHPDALAQLAETQAEIDLYRKYADCYGYVFYLMQAR